jgi:O-antigen/teichoic acid export membrane protein
MSPRSPEGGAPSGRRKGTVQSEATATFTFQIATMVAGAITNIVIARTLGPDGKGVLALLGYALFLATSLGALGGQASTIYLIGKGRFSKEDVTASVGATSLLAGIACAVGTWVLLPKLRGSVPLTPMMIMVTAAAVIPAMLRLNLSGIFLATGRMFAYNMSLASMALGWSAAAAVLLVVFHGDISSAVYLWCGIQIVGSLGGVLYALAIAPPRMARFVPALRASLGFGTQTYLVNLVWILVLRVDSFILAHYRTASEVGIYSIAVLVAEVVLHLPRSLTLVLTRRFAAGALLPAARLAARASRLGSLGVLGLGVCILACARIVTPLLFGRAFTASVPPMLWLLPGILALSIASPLSLYLVQQRGKPIWTGTAATVALVTNVGLNMFWIPRYGAVGAAWASSAAYTMHMLIVAILFRHETGLAFREIFAPRKEDIRTWLDLMPFTRAGSRS